MKKTTILITLFVIYTIIIKTNHTVTEFDRFLICVLQERLDSLPIWIPMLFDSKLYTFLIVLPLLMGIVYFIRYYLIIDLFLFTTSPLMAYLLNIIVKNIVQRPRPPIDLQLAVQPSTYSFVSSHTLVMTTLWGLVIYYLNNYCKNVLLKTTGTILAILLIVFEGLSRVWLGVHNPSDVFGGYFLASIVLYIYIRFIKIIGGKC